MKLYFSNLSEFITQSEIRNMSIECDRLGGINMSQGICDMALPPPVSHGAKAAMDHGHNHYTRYDGVLELRNAIAEKMVRFNRIPCDPEKNIIVSAGATGALYSTCLALLDPGDEVILFEPYYGYHVSTLAAVGVRPVFVPLARPDWALDLDALERAVTPKTRAIIVCTPANPSGKAFTAEEINALADFVLRHGMFVFTDEIYEYFLYEGRRHISPGSIERIADRTITISGYSKTFSITGWRIGYAVCHEKWSRMIGYVSDLVYVCAPAPLQFGVAEGILQLGQDYYDELRNIYQRKRNVLCDTLSAIGLTPHVPDGAYYVLADVGHLVGASAKDKAMFMLKTTGVATVPGSAFFSGSGGNDLVRFCYAKDDQVIEEACQRLRTLL